MKLEPNHIDDIFRHRLHDAEVPPPAFVWPNVERELQQRKRWRFFLWLFAFGVAGTGLWAMYARHNATTPVPTHRIADHKNGTLAPVSEQQTGNPPSPAPQPSGQNAPAGGAYPDSGVELSNTSPKNGRGAIPKTKQLQTGTLPAQDIDYTPAYVGSVDVEERPNAISGGGPESMGAVGFLPDHKKTGEPLVFQRENPLPQAKIFIRKKKDPKYCYDFAQNPNVWMLDAYAGPSFSKRTFEATEPGFEDYAAMRRATEESDWAFNAGLRGTLLWGRHFLIRTGLHYEQMTDVFEHVDPNYVKYIVEITQTIVDNKPVIVIDTVGVEYGENYVKTYNRYGMLDVPLEIGGELRRGRFGLSINAGMAFNILFWKRGTILSPEGQPESFTPGEKGATEVYRTRTGWSAGGSAQLFFHLQPTLRVFAEPYYRQILKPITLDDQPVEQRNSNWGLKIGVTKILD